MGVDFRGESIGKGSVLFGSEREAQRAALCMHQSDLAGQKINVDTTTEASGNGASKSLFSLYKAYIIRPSHWQHTGITWAIQMVRILYLAFIVREWYLYSGSKYCPNVLLFQRDELTVDQINYIKW